MESHENRFTLWFQLHFHCIMGRYIFSICINFIIELYSIYRLLYVWEYCCCLCMQCIWSTLSRSPLAVNLYIYIIQNCTHARTLKTHYYTLSPIFMLEFSSSLSLCDVIVIEIVAFHDFMRYHSHYQLYGYAPPIPLRIEQF